MRVWGGRNVSQTCTPGIHDIPSVRWTTGVCTSHHDTVLRSHPYLQMQRELQNVWINLAFEVA